MHVTGWGRDAKKAGRDIHSRLAAAKGYYNDEPSTHALTATAMIQERIPTLFLIAICTLFGFAI